MASIRGIGVPELQHPNWCNVLSDIREATGWSDYRIEVELQLVGVACQGQNINKIRRGVTLNPRYKIGAGLLWVRDRVCEE